MTAKKGLGKGLGKGLDSLIVEKIEIQKIESDVSRETLVNINMVEPNRDQPRRQFNEDTLQELADSIKIHGVIQPLIVQKKDKMFEIIAGERRWRAARLAGLKEIPVIIKEYSKQEIFEVALIENIQREDLNAIEEAAAYHKLIEDYNLKQDEVADRVGKSRTAVTNSMRLLRLDQRIQQMLIDEMISGGHARALLSIKSADEQYKIANKVFDEKLSVRETEKLVKRILNEKPIIENTAAKRNEFIYQELESKMRDILGSKVEIKRKQNNKGKIEIEYYSMDELERLIELIGSIEKAEHIA